MICGHLRRQLVVMAKGPIGNGRDALLLAIGILYRLSVPCWLCCEQYIVASGLFPGEVEEVGDNVLVHDDTAYTGMGCSIHTIRSCHELFVVSAATSKREYIL
jgi:hypothetical protein